MRILLTNWAYNMLCGSQTFIYTILGILRKRGCQPLIFSDHVDGVIAEKSRGFAEISADVETLRPWDVVWGSHQILRRVPAGAPRCQIVHAVVSREHEMPISGLDGYFAVSEETRNLVESCGLPCDGILRQPIDTGRFQPGRPVGWPPRILHLGNYPIHNDVVRKACEQNGIQFESVGGPVEGGGRIWDVETAINWADIVVGQSRCVLEAMACGRNAIVCSGWSVEDGYGLCGFVTEDRYERWVRQDNLTGRVESRIPTEESFLHEVRKYDPGLGACLRRKILENHEPETAIEPLIRWTESVTGKKLRNPL